MRLLTMAGERAAELEELGIVRDTADAGFEQNLAPTRASYELDGALASPRHATTLDLAVGQWLTVVRRPGGPGKDTDRAQRRARHSWTRSTPTGARGRWGGRSTDSATTPTSPSS
ncbi:hypothetical protein [Streptomyces sp. NBC_01207]|uniref:hypothetical protein n=1 Tax=Streptomyces sp. NBC_01207 TaxID=2903772 RepID=UPI002E0D5050|nr:hypothetical protein OG457_44595 [Streptomyces sp. NBC_01207]WTA23901.1 hypothetical protein OG365_38255 [Streptomyces sp. NBC_00853]